MRTTLFFDRGIKTPIMQDIEATWQRVQHTGVCHVCYAGTTTYVCYAPDGVSVQFEHRLAEIPLEMEAHPPKKVRVKYIERNLRVMPGIYRKRGVTLVCESSIATPQKGDPYELFVITVDGPVLGEVNDFLDRFLSNHVEEVTFDDVKRLLARKARVQIARLRFALGL